AGKFYSLVFCRSDHPGFPVYGRRAQTGDYIRNFSGDDDSSTAVGHLFCSRNQRNTIGGNGKHDEEMKNTSGFFLLICSGRVSIFKEFRKPRFRLVKHPPSLIIRENWFT